MPKIPPATHRTTVSKSEYTVYGNLFIYIYIQKKESLVKKSDVLISTFNILCSSFWCFQGKEEPHCKIDNLNCAENGKPREKSHGASYETKLTLRGQFDASQDFVVCVCVKVDLNQLKGGIVQLNWRYELTPVEECLLRVKDEILHKLPFEPLVLFQQLGQLVPILSVFCSDLSQRFVE